MAEWLSVVQGGESARKVNLRRPIFPAIERAITISQQYFEGWILKPRTEGGQDVLKGKASREALLGVLGDTSLEDALKESWAADEESSVTRWAELTKEVKKVRSGLMSLNRSALFALCFRTRCTLRHRPMVPRQHRCAKRPP